MCGRSRHTGSTTHGIKTLKELGAAIVSLITKNMKEGKLEGSVYRAGTYTGPKHNCLKKLVSIIIYIALIISYYKGSFGFNLVSKFLMAQQFSMVSFIGGSTSSNLCSKLCYKILFKKLHVTFIGQHDCQHLYLITTSVLHNLHSTSLHDCFLRD